MNTEEGEIHVSLNIHSKYRKLKRKYFALETRLKETQEQLDTQRRYTNALKKAHDNMTRHLEEKKQACSVGCISLFDHQRILEERHRNRQTRFRSPE